MKSLYLRLSLVFLFLTLSLALVIGWQSLQSATRFVDESEQKLNRELAGILAVDFQPFLVDSIDTASIQDKIEYFIGINPKIDIYLLGNTGMIKALFVPSGREPIMGALDTEPMNQFLAGAELPLWGQDPLSETGMKPFSVAPLEIMGEQGCYLYVVLGSDEYDTTAAMIEDSYIMRSLLQNVVLVLLVTVIVGLLLFAIITRRIGHILRSVKKFAQGDYSARIELQGGDEVAQLATTVDQMAETIEENIRRLEDEDRLRRELVANISHDLRSPLASIRGYLETILIKMDDLSPEELTQYVETGIAGTMRLNRLVEDLFELSKLDANQISLQAEPFALNDLVQDVVLQFQPNASEAGISLIAEFQDDPSLAFGDIGLVERAMSNLIDNAIKYTPEGGEVRVVPKSDGKHIQINVIDTGNGIPEAELPYIFDRFYTVDKSRNQVEGATGLGLAITKKIVELHESTLSVTSRLNAGTTFSFWLPTANQGALSPVLG